MREILAGVSIAMSEESIGEILDLFVFGWFMVCWWTWLWTWLWVFWWIHFTYPAAFTVGIDEFVLRWRLWYWAHCRPLRCRWRMWAVGIISLMSIGEISTFWFGCSSWFWCFFWWIHFAYPAAFTVGIDEFVLRWRFGNLAHLRLLRCWWGMWAVGIISLMSIG